MKREGRIRGQLFYASPDISFLYQKQQRMFQTPAIIERSKYQQLMSTKHETIAQIGVPMKRMSDDRLNCICLSKCAK
jgi:hypothetical protein